MAEDVAAQLPKTADPGIRTMIAGDGVRGIGMLTVFGAHLLLFASQPPPSFHGVDPGFSSFGAAKGVLGHIDLALAAFFVLSGYLISRPFARAYVIGTRRPSVRRFATNRVLRIVPAFYLFATLVLLRFGLDGTLGSGIGNPAHKLVGNSTWWQVLGIYGFVQAQVEGPARAPIGQGWSVGSEVFFYALVPIAAALAYRLGARLSSPKRRAIAALVALVIIEFASIRARAQHPFQFAWLVSPAAILYVFLPGVAIALAEPLFAGKLRDNAKLAMRTARWLFGLSLLVAIVYAVSDYSAQTTPLHHVLGRRALLAAICSGGFILGLVVMQLGTGRAPRWLANRLSLWMGARSYSFYLVHVWVLLEIGHVLGNGHSELVNGLWMLVIGLPISVALAALSYHFVERPFLERKRPTLRSGDPEAVGPVVGNEPRSVGAAAGA